MYQSSQKEMVLLYNIKNKPFTPKLKTILLRLGIRIKAIEPQQFGCPINSLVSKSAPAAPLAETDQTPFTDEMMVMVGLTNARLDVFLKALRKEGIRIPLKAILTPLNGTWNSYELHDELVREHEKMMELAEQQQKK